jgi:hypothetical protein
MVALLLAAVVLSGCGTSAPAQAEPGAQTDILPTPVPIPTGEPRPPTPTPPPAPGSEQSVAAANALMSADFGNQSLENWNVVDTTDLIQSPSIWEINGGRLAQVSDGDGIPSMYGTAMVTGQADWTDYQVSAAAYNTGNDEFGLVARSGEQGMYIFRIVPSSSGSENVLSRYDTATGYFTDIAKTEGPALEEGRWYVLSVTVKGDSLQASIDGQPVVKGSDTTLTQGAAGVYGFAQGNLQFDNFTVQAASN